MASILSHSLGHFHEDVMVFCIALQPFAQGYFFICAEPSVHLDNPITGLVIEVLVGWHAVYIVHGCGPLGARLLRLITALLCCCCPLPVSPILL